MPVTPSYPGVYIEEISSGVHTITGVSTSITAFFGRTQKGPLNKAVRILNLSDFTREFGGAHPSSDLAQSVKQFFDNGGADCYVVRLAQGAQEADVILKNRDNTNVLKATAKNAGNWGNGIRLEVDYKTPNPDETFNLRVFHEENGKMTASDGPFTNLSMNPDLPRYAPVFVTQNSELIDLELFKEDDQEFDLTSNPGDAYSQSGRPFDTSNGSEFHSALNDLIQKTGHFEISVNGAQFVHIDLSGLTITHTDREYRNEAEEAIQGEINAQLTGVSIECKWVQVDEDIYVLRISSNNGNGSSVRIHSTPTNDLAGPMMLGLEQGGIETAHYSNHRPVPTATMLAGKNINDINTLAIQEQSAFNQITLSGTGITLKNGNSYPLDLGTDLQTTDPGDQWYRDNLRPEVNSHNDGIREKLRIIAKKVNEDPNLTCRAEVWGYHLAFIPTKGTINNTIQVSSQQVSSEGEVEEGGINIGPGPAETDLDLFTPNVRQYSLGTTGAGGSFQNGAGAVGRDDDGKPLEISAYTGSEEDQTGFYALDGVYEFNLMVLPADRDIDDDKYLQLIGPASIYCQKKRAFLLIDAPKSWTVKNRPKADSIEVNKLRQLVVKDHSAVFYPRIQYTDDNGIKRYTGPSGMIAGLMARNDKNRGVWKAPAGIPANLSSVKGLEVKLTDKENGVLNKLGANCIREFPNGFVNWGARTMDGSDDIGSEWKYIPIRRLALFIEESLYRGTKWVVFEPNDEPLWAKIRLNIGVFMTRLFEKGAFQGSSSNKAFFVKCDAETTTQADRNLGIVNIVVGFAPLKPAEFVIIKIQQIAGDLI